MNELFSLFEEMGYKNAEGFFRQGSLANRDYPAKFFTFWNIDTPNASFYDNEERRYIEHVQVGFYTTDAAEVYSEMENFITRAKSKGFVVVGRAQDVNADEDNYFGRICIINIIHNIQEE